MPRRKRLAKKRFTVEDGEVLGSPSASPSSGRVKWVSGKPPPNRRGSIVPWLPPGEVAAAGEALAAASKPRGPPQPTAARQPGDITRAGKPGVKPSPPSLQKRDVAGSEAADGGRQSAQGSPVSQKKKKSRDNLRPPPQPKGKHLGGASKQVAAGASVWTQRAQRRSVDASEQGGAQPAGQTPSSSTPSSPQGQEVLASRESGMVQSARKATTGKQGGKGGRRQRKARKGKGASAATEVSDMPTSVPLAVGSEDEAGDASVEAVGAPADRADQDHGPDTTTEGAAEGDVTTAEGAAEGGDAAAEGAAEGDVTTAEGAAEGGDAAAEGAAGGDVTTAEGEAEGGDAAAEGAAGGDVTTAEGEAEGGDAAAEDAAEGAAGGDVTTAEGAAEGGDAAAEGAAGGGESSGNSGLDLPSKEALSCGLPGAVQYQYTTQPRPGDTQLGKSPHAVTPPFGSAFVQPLVPRLAPQATVDTKPSKASCAAIRSQMPPITTAFAELAKLRRSSQSTSKEKKSAPEGHPPARHMGSSTQEVPDHTVPVPQQSGDDATHVEESPAVESPLDTDSTFTPPAEPSRAVHRTSKPFLSSGEEVQSPGSSHEAEATRPTIRKRIVSDSVQAAVEAGNTQSQLQARAVPIVSHVSSTAKHLKVALMTCYKLFNAGRIDHAGYGSLKDAILCQQSTKVACALEVYGATEDEADLEDTFMRLAAQQVF